MAHVKANPLLIKKLTADDKQALLEIYRHRCLDEVLLYQFIYIKTDVDREYTTSRVRFLKRNELVEAVSYGQAFPALFLTTLGVKTLELLVIMGELEGVSIEKKAADLKMNKTIISHQMHLNLFAMQAVSYISKYSACRYFDSKMMPPASDFLMPDGMLELPDCFVFLEMDMGTEDAKRFMQKWESYRGFLHYRGDFYSQKPIIMLFILEGVKLVHIRRKTVAKSLNEALMPMVSDRFDVYIGGSKELHNVLLSRVSPDEGAFSQETQKVYKLLRQHGFSVSRPQFLKEKLPSFGVYVRKLNEQKRIAVLNGRAQEFILDVWNDRRFSVLHNIAYFGQSASATKSLTGRTIPYLVILPSEDAVLEVTEIIGSLPKSVFFSTIDRLFACNWPEALFRIDYNGNLVHFKDYSLTDAVFEKTMRTPKVLS